MELGFTLVYAVTMIVALQGNILLIYIVWRKRETRTLTSFLFVNMAIADLLIAVLLRLWIHWCGRETILPICNLSCECIHDSLDLQPCRDGIRSTFCCYTPFEANDLVPKSQNYSTVIWIASCSLMVITPFSFMVRDSLGKCFYTDEHIPWVPFWTYLLLINYIMPLAIISCAKDMVPRNSWPTWIFQTPARWAYSKEKSCSNAHYCCGGFCGLLVSYASA